MEVQCQGVSIVMFYLVRAFFRVEYYQLLTMSSPRGEGEGSLWDPFYTGTYSIPDSSTLMT